jgi:hypothetical protein
MEINTTGNNTVQRCGNIFLICLFYFTAAPSHFKIFKTNTYSRAVDVICNNPTVSMVFVSLPMPLN